MHEFDRNAHVSQGSSKQIRLVFVVLNEDDEWETVMDYCLVESVEAKLDVLLRQVIPSAESIA